MGFNKRKMEDRRRQAAEQEAAARRATEKQILEDADHLIGEWNERQAKRMPMLFSPTIGAAITAGYWFLRARCPACRTTGDVDLRKLDWHRGAAVTALTPALSCRSCRPNAPFAELVVLVEVELSCRGVLRRLAAATGGSTRVIERLACGPEPDVGGELFGPGPPGTPEKAGQPSLRCYKVTASSRLNPANFGNMRWRTGGEYASATVGER